MSRSMVSKLLEVRLEISVVRMFLVTMVILLHLSAVKVEDYYADMPYGQMQKRENGEDAVNDDIIVSRVTRECPNEADGSVDCTDSMHNKESLIYPVAEFSTRKTQTPRSSTLSKSAMTASARDSRTDCSPEDENCEGSGEDTSEDDDGDEDDDDDEDEDDDEGNENINLGTDNYGKSTHNLPRNKPPNSKHQPGASKSTAAQPGQGGETQPRHPVVKPPHGSAPPGKGDGDWPHRRSSTANTLLPLSAASPASNNNHQTYMGTSQDVSSSSIKDRQYQQLAINMNIVLIAGIAAGIVVLLCILVIAACRFYNSSTAPTGAKAINDYHQQRMANKAAYAYEACNTGGKCSSPLLVPSSQQSLPALTATSQAALTSVGSTTSTVSKPVKKDVKEWYV